MISKNKIDTTRTGILMSSGFLFKTKPVLIHLT